MRLSSAIVSLRTAARLPAVCALAALWMAVPVQARQPKPEISILLEPLGFGTIPPAYLQAGQTMFTLNFVDNNHLLLTFNTKGLLARLADATPEDEDRNVAALLLELPSGKVVARTVWRTRDHARYLWPVGNGRFLLRVRNRFSVVAPGLNLGSGDAFREQRLIEADRRIALVDVSPDGGMLLVETAPPLPPPLLGAAASAAALAATAPGPKLKARTGGSPDFVLHFYRLMETADPAEGRKLVAVNAGMVRSREPVEVAMTPQGYLSAVKESGPVYDFDFHTNSGKKLELSPFDTSCSPHAMFTSLTDFVAFGCRGGAERNELSAFNLRGEEPWISVITGTQLATFMMSAPAAGRFALGLTTSLPIPGSADDSLRANGQQVQVMQHHDGRVLLTVSTAPAQLSGQNFDLSPDGLELAAVQGEHIGVYRLPGLSGPDHKAIAKSLASLSEPAEGPMRLEAATSGAQAVEPVEEAPTTATAAAPPPASASAAAAPPALGSQSAGGGSPAAAGAGVRPGPVNGDVETEEGHRKPPSLYDADHP